jgi:DNA-binding NarL/FixJ family response regulator
MSKKTRRNETIKVWIVEDTANYRNMLRKMLNGCETIKCDYAFESMEEAIPVFRLGECPDVVLVDIQLPGINGIEGIKTLKAMYPALQPIVLTISENRTTVFEAICAGASGYLLKNDPFDAIRRGIHLVHEGGSPLSAPIASMVLNAFRHIPVAGTDHDLTEREIQILQLLSDGLIMKEIGAALFISKSTVDYHLRSIYLKLQVHSQAGAVGKALRKGLI